MRSRAALFVFGVLPELLTGSCSPSHSGVAALLTSASNPVWIHIDGEWQQPPPDPAHPSDYRSALATLIRFTSDHEFSMMHCWIIDHEKKLTISPGDGQAVFVGSWNDSGSVITAHFRLVYETMQPIGGRHYPGPEESVTVSRAGHSVEFRGKLFDEANSLDDADYEKFIRPERAKLTRTPGLKE